VFRLTNSSPAQCQVTFIIITLANSNSSWIRENRDFLFLLIFWEDHGAIKLALYIYIYIYHGSCLHASFGFDRYSCINSLHVVALFSKHESFKACLINEDGFLKIIFQKFFFCVSLFIDKKHFIVKKI
jgi:hypothetical protein